MKLKDVSTGMCVLAGDYWVEVCERFISQSEYPIAQTGKVIFICPEGYRLVKNAKTHRIYALPENTSVE